MEFAGFLGNRELKARLSGSFDTGRASHAYLLCGPKGSGKRTLAKILAAAFQCTAEAGVPCGHCNQCRKVFGDIHPDVITVDDPEKKILPVDKIREARTDAFLRPNEGKRKIYVIPRAQDMNENGQNALLKLIEEPPAYGVFFLLTDNAGRMLPTIRSRCAELRLEPVAKQEALAWLLQRHPAENRETLENAVFRSGGYLGQAEEILQNGGLDPKTEEFVRAFGEKDRFGMRWLLCSMEKMSRDKLGELLRQWLDLTAEAMTVRSGLPGTAQAVAMGRKRTLLELKEGADHLRKALQLCEANVGTGHLCGWLAVHLS